MWPRFDLSENTAGKMMTISIVTGIITILAFPLIQSGLRPPSDSIVVTESKVYPSTIVIRDDKGEIVQQSIHEPKILGFRALDRISVINRGASKFLKFECVPEGCGFDKWEIKTTDNNTIECPRNPVTVLPGQVKEITAVTK